MTVTFDLTGAWSADDGGIYFIRQLADGSVTWAGLHDSGFHMGVEFTNVFQGQISSDGTMITGDWADVPRGGTMNAGELTLAIILSDVRGTTVPAELEQIPDGTSGGFGGTVWTAGASELGAHDIETIDGEIRRYDVALGDNNPPCRDFSVMWGTVTGGKGTVGTEVQWPTLPPAPGDYCSFLNSSWNGDGDLAFTITPDWSLTELEFWTKGWLDVTRPTPQGHFPASIAINWMYYQFNDVFHCEAAMFGRSNTDCTEPPTILLPAWSEQGGNSVLVNGLPINGNLLKTWDLSTIPNAPPPPNAALSFKLSRGGKAVASPLLAPGKVVRVSGVVADDAGHEDQVPPEIHPLYSLDIVDFSTTRPEPRPGPGPGPSPVVGESVDLTGAWHGGDAGTYYLRQIGSTIWWLGLSRDQGRAFANVFRGTLSGQLIEGSWVDVPVGTGGTRDDGSLMIFSSGALTTEITKVSTDLFGAKNWTKLYDIPPPGVLPNA